MNFFWNFSENTLGVTDLFDELGDLIRKVKSHQAHMGKSSDEKTKKMIRTSIKNVVRNISHSNTCTRKYVE